MRQFSGNPRVSVVTPVYNGARYLGQTIESILRQDFVDFEYILVDDASSDESTNLIRSFSDPRLRLISNTSNQGVVCTRNRGIACSRGEYIALTDQDDISLPTRLADQVCFMDTHPEIALLGAWHSYIDSEGQPLQRRICRRYTPAESRASLLFRNIFGNSTLLFRREATPNPPYATEYPLAEDYNFLIRVSEHHQIHLLPKIEVLHRLHANNQSKTGREQQLTLGKRRKSELLRDIGCAANDGEVELHDNLESNNLEATAELLRETRHWLECVVNAAYLETRYDRHIVRKLAGNEWFELCRRASFLGLHTWREFHKSQLACDSHYRSLSHLQLLLKCLRPPVTRVRMSGIHVNDANGDRPRRPI